MKDIKGAIEAYKKGLSIPDVSKKFGIPKTSFGRYLTKAGVKKRKYTKSKKHIPDFKGKKFGKLTALEPVVESEGRVLWLCECECGTQQKVRQSHLVANKKEMCGNCQTIGENNFAWKGCGQLSGTYWKRLKANAKRRASGPIDFNVSIEYAWKLYLKQSGRCALSGLDIPFPNKVEDGFVASIDRIDSSKGYIEGNIQWVHKDVNKMKMDFSQDHFINMCQLIAEQNGG